MGIVRIFVVLTAFAANVFAGTALESIGGRSYFVHTPSAKVDSPPLVLALHGAGGTGDQFERMTGLSAIADREGFVAIYPNGIDRRWNDGRGVTSTDDVGFLTALIQVAVARFNVNPNRVYVLGFSNGGTMAYRMACERSELVTAIAPIAGSMALPVFSACTPAKPVSVFGIEGTEDPIIPFFGGTVQFGSSGDRGIVVAAETNRDFWAQKNGCTQSRDIRLPDLDGDGNDSLRWIRESCSFATRVEITAVSRGGHKYPGVDNGFGGQPAIDQALGPVTYDFNGTESAWAFFKSLPLRARRVELEQVALTAFVIFSGKPLTAGPSLDYWVNFLFDRQISSVPTLVAFLRSQYGTQQATAEAIVRQAFLDYDGSIQTGDSLKYWVGAVQGASWTYAQLLNHLVTTYVPQPGTAELIVARVFRDYDGSTQTGDSLAYWVNVVRANQWTYSRLLSHLVTTYLPQSGTAEAIVQQAFRDYDGSTQTGDSLAYWANVVRSNTWTYRRLVSYLAATYLSQPGAAEAIVRKAFLDYDGSTQSGPSFDYWVNAVRTNQWLYVQLYTHLVTTYVPQAGSAEIIVNNVFRYWDGSVKSGAELAYWASVVRQNRWGYTRLLGYLFATYFSQPGTAEAIVRKAFGDWDGSSPTGASFDYWVNAVRSNRWTYAVLLTHLVTTYLPQPGSAEVIVRKAFQDVLRASPSAPALTLFSDIVRARQWTYAVLVAQLAATVKAGQTP